MNALRVVAAVAILLVGLGLYVLSYFRPGGAEPASLVPLMLAASAYLFGRELKEQVQKVRESRRRFDERSAAARANDGDRDGAPSQ